MAEVLQRHRELATDAWRKATGSRPDFYNVIPAVAAFIAEACEAAVAAERERCADHARERMIKTESLVAQVIFERIRSGMAK